jgi:hypothetical protein
MGRFEIFVMRHCTTKGSIANTDEITKYHQEMNIILKGLDLWDSASPDILENYKLHYLMHYVGFPTGSQNVERGINLSNHCSLQKRGEAQRSLYATAGSESIKNSID